MVANVRILLLVVSYQIAVGKGAAKLALKPLPETNSWLDFLRQTANVSALEQPERALTPLPSAIDWLLLPSGSDDSTEPCRWPGNVVCSSLYRPICVTNLRCIYIMHNKCQFDKINCGCPTHYILPPKLCQHFIDPYYKRCNLQVFVQ